MKVCIYGRTSTADQEVANQLIQLKDYAAKQGWEVVYTLLDVGSGSKGRAEREGLDKVFTLAHQRKFDLLLFWALDRFSREGSRQTIAYLSQLESLGVGFHSFSEPYLSTLGVFSDCIIALLSALAKQERIRIGERTKAGLERAKTSGKKLGRPSTVDVRGQEAKKLKGEGLSLRQIGERMGVSRSRVHQLVNCRHQNHYSPVHKEIATS
jgi:putative DNA-invertase from lambdoid prophage Rac